MARLGSWDIGGAPTTWFDITALRSGWVDRDEIPFWDVPPAPLGNPLLLGGQYEDARDYAYFFRTPHEEFIAWARIESELEGDLEALAARQTVPAGAEEGAAIVPAERLATVTIFVGGRRYVISRKV
jgi:hypothetical protein